MGTQFGSPSVTVDALAGDPVFQSTSRYFSMEATRLNRAAVAQFNNDRSNAALRNQPLPVTFTWTTFDAAKLATIYQGMAADNANFRDPELDGLNEQDCLVTQKAFIPAGAVVSVDVNGALSLGPPASVPVKVPQPDNPLGSAVAGYPRLFHAAVGDAHDPGFVYVAPDGSRYAKESSIVFGPVYEAL